MKATSLAPEIVGDRRPLPLRSAARWLSKCMLRSGALTWRRAISHPRDHVGEVLRFGDGSGGRVYRETIVPHTTVDSPAVLVVAFRLR